jgi:hypothetical protein
MRLKVLAFAASLLMIANSSAGIPQTPTVATSSAQAATLLAQSAKALTGATVVNDVTLTGSAEWIAGSEDETGTATYKGLNNAYRLDLTFRNGTRSEIVSPTNGMPSGNWIGLDGGLHAIAKHNLTADPGWFPTFTLGNLMSSPNSALNYVGQETRNGSTVIHISAYQQSPNISADVASRMQHFTQVEIYLDPSTFLPVLYTYNSHPDDNALVDLPTEIRYSNYQNVAGVQMPFHIQKYVNSTLAIDIHLQSASLNNGLTAAQIAAQ